MTEERALAITGDGGMEDLIRLVTDGVPAANSKRVYRTALRQFLGWYRETRQTELTKRVVQRYQAVLQERGNRPRTVNLKMAALRKMALEAVDNGLLSEEALRGILRIKGLKTHGVRNGNWLTWEELQRLLKAPDVNTLKGLRDRVALWLCGSAALRRSEAVALTYGHIAQEQGHWVISNLEGKGNRVRTFGIASPLKVAIDEWTEAAAIEPQGRILRSMAKGDRLVHERMVDGKLKTWERMSSQGVRNVVEFYAKQLGLNENRSSKIAPHDLRRTSARLAYDRGAGMAQIMIWLGHASIQTTERYINAQLDLANCPADKLGFRL